MKPKKTFYAEAAYAVGIAVLALGTALMERANFGMSMVVAPAYLIHLKLSQSLPFFSFGMAEYALQAALLVALALVMGKFKRGYLFSFVTAVIYGFVLDGAIALVGCLPAGGTFDRVVCYVVGLVACSVGVSLLFHTYLPPEAYELFVAELSDRLGTDVSRTKTIYDLCSCAVSVVHSFAFFGFGRFEGVKLGTVLCALVNGWLIGRINRLLERRFEFWDALPWREAFTR